MNAMTAVSAIAIAILILPPAVSRLFWKRSLRAAAVEFILRHSRRPDGFYRDDAGIRKVMEEIRAGGEKPYVIPRRLRFPCTVTERRSHGMQVFTMNGSSESEIVVFYIPGGSFSHRMKTYHWKMLSRIVSLTDSKIEVVQYPLLPFHDCTSVYPAMTELFTEVMSENPGCRIILAGDSAGANIAVRVEECLTASGSRQPDELILLSPASGMRGTYPPGLLEELAAKCPMITVEACWTVAAMWAGKEKTVEDPDVSPLYGVVSGMCRTYIFTGTRDLFYYESLELYEEMKAKGNDCFFDAKEGMNHVYQVMPIPEARGAVRKLCRIILGE